MPRTRIAFIWGGPDKFDGGGKAMRKHGEPCKSPGNWTVFWTNLVPADTPIESMVLRTGGAERMRAAPNPTAVRDFAQSLGWVLVSEAMKDRLYVFNHADKPGRQIVFPMDTAAPDYVEGVRRALVKLGELHKLSLDHVSMAVGNTKEDGAGQ